MQSLNFDNNLWQRFQTINEKSRLPQALCLIGPEFANLVDLTYAMAKSLVCMQAPKPCDQCKSCHLMKLREHPDLHFLEPDDSGLIKIDEIRDLQSFAFRSPLLSDQRIIILYQAEKMNKAAANALLKLLEEPPASLRFFLVAENLLNIPATIISRCQLWRAKQENDCQDNYLKLGQGYSAESGRRLIFQQLAVIVEGLIQVQQNKISSCTLAEQWTSYEFEHLIWLLYLLNSQLIYYKLVSSKNQDQWSASLDQLAKFFDLIQLFNQMDQLNQISKKLQLKININQLLVLENFLLGYKVQNNEMMLKSKT